MAMDRSVTPLLCLFLAERKRLVSRDGRRIMKCPACCTIWYGMVFARFPCLLAPKIDGWSSGDIPQLNLFQSS